MNGGQNKFYHSEVVQVEVISGNSGGEPFQDVKVAYYLNDQFLEDDNMRHWNIENGDEKDEEMYLIIPSTLGMQTLKASVDYNNEIGETDENDNVACINFEIVEPPPEADDLTSSTTTVENSSTTTTVYPETTTTTSICQTTTSSSTSTIHHSSTSTSSSTSTIHHSPPPNSTTTTSAHHSPPPETTTTTTTSEGEDPAEKTPEEKLDGFLKALFSSSFIRFGCEYFFIVKRFDYGDTGDFSLIFYPYLYGLYFTGQSYPNEAWIDYEAINNAIEINDWPIGGTIEFSVFANSNWLDASNCPEYFQDDPDPQDQHFKAELY